MPRTFLRIAWGAVAAFVGYLVIAGGTTLTFTLWLEGAFGSSAPLSVISQGTAGAALSGLCGGYVAALLGRRSPVAHAAGVLVFLALDTTYALIALESQDPLWFDLFGSLILAATALLGGLLRQQQIRRVSVATRTT
jgi:hypothetical protein